MKKINLFLLMALFCNLLHSQNDSIATKQKVVFYSFFLNTVPDNFLFPLIGFVNTATGNHRGLQVGFLNTTLKNFEGVQIGFVNTTLENINGLQVGFVNTAKKGIKGSQIGFVNYADTITGVPIGFISIVKKGGYKAVEISVNEFYPVNLSFKIGVPKLYSFVKCGYNPDFEQNFALGGGLGALLSLWKNFYFNPEISQVNSLGCGAQQQFVSFAGNLRYKLWSNFHIAAGPSVVWQHLNEKGNLYNPIYSVVNKKIDDKNRLLVGARAALSIDF